jgi:hypothetical protein
VIIGVWGSDVLVLYLEANLELGFEGDMYGMADAAWSSSSVSSSRSCLLLADFSRHRRGEVHWPGLSWSRG